MKKIIVTESQAKKIVDTLINESYSGEGVADKFFEKQFAKPSDFKGFESEMKKQEEMSSDVVGIIKGDHVKTTRIYINPKNLDNFDKDVRAISDKEGNLYVPQIESLFDHRDIANALNDGKKTKPQNFNDMSTHAHWYRLRDKNIFFMSSPTRDFLLKNPKKGNMIKKAVQAKFPQYRFL